MQVLNFTNSSKSVNLTANCLEGSLKLGDGHDDIVERFNAGETPVVRNGIAKNGECLIEVGDRTSNTQSLASLMTLHSPVGQGAFTITIDGVIYSRLALVDVYVVGTSLQLVKVVWKGTVENIAI